MLGKLPTPLPRVMIPAVIAVFILAGSDWSVAQVSPGDTITSANVANVKDLVSPGVYQMVSAGNVSLKVVAPQKINWPPPYKDATEKYSAQVSLSPDHRSLAGYTAGLPFPRSIPTIPARQSR